MLSWALTFFILALVASLFGFGTIATASTGFAQILFYIFLGLFFLSLLSGFIQKGDRGTTTRKIS